MLDSLDDVNLAVRRVTFGWPLLALKPRIVVMEPPRSAFDLPAATAALMIQVTVPHRDFGTPVVIGFPCKTYLPTPEDQLFALIRAAIIDGMKHEVDESLLVDGQRKWDPHAPPTVPTFDFNFTFRREGGSDLSFLKKLTAT